MQYTDKLPEGCLEKEMAQMLSFTANDIAYALKTPRFIFLPVVFQSCFFDKTIIDHLRSQWDAPVNIFHLDL